MATTWIDDEQLVQALQLDKDAEEAFFELLLRVYEEDYVQTMNDFIAENTNSDMRVLTAEDTGDCIVWEI